MALSAIGKDPTKVGGVDLVGAYSANGFNWIKKQGLNGPVFALIALDTYNYKTSDATIRQQCVNYILAAELSGGGWALSGTAGAGTLRRQRRCQGRSRAWLCSPFENPEG